MASKTKSKKPKANTINRAKATNPKLKVLLALVVILIVVVTGIIVVRFSRADTYSVADNTFMASVGSITQNTNGYYWIVKTSDGKQLVAYANSNTDPNLRLYPSGAIEWVSEVGNTGKKSCYTIAIREGWFKPDHRYNTATAHPSRIRPGDVMVFTRKGEGNNQGCAAGHSY